MPLKGHAGFAGVAVYLPRILMAAPQAAPQAKTFFAL
jgi:hypothetical protein